MVFITKGQRANAVLYVEESSNYVYQKDRKRASLWYMKCHVVSCPGRAKMCGIPEDITEFDFSEVVMEETKQHNHPPEEYIKEVNELKGRILTACASESGDMHQIFKKLCAEVPVEIASKLEWTKFYYSMKRVRKSLVPAVPTTMRGLDEAIMSAMSRFGEVEGKQFYQGTVEAAGKISCMFVTTQLLPLLRSACMWHVDGTFKTVPRLPPGRQLVTIMANDGDKVYPVVYIIMPCKEKESYVAVLRKLKSEFNLNPPAIMADYEASLRSAIKEVYPRVDLRGCWFHFAQAIVKFVSTHGLKTALTTNRAFGNIIKMMIALALLPAEDIAAGFDHVKRNVDAMEITDQIQPVLEYFRNYWMGTIGPENFSVNGSNVRTNNSQESYHAQLLRCLGKSHPGIWQFIDGLMHMAGAAIRDHTRVQDGAGVSFGRSGKWAFHERTIIKSLRDLERGAISVSRFLHYAVRFFHLEGISNYVDEDFEEGWDEELFNDEEAFDEDEASYSPPDDWHCRPHVVPSSEKVRQSFTTTQLGLIGTLGEDEGSREAAAGEPACLFCLQNAATRLASPCGHRQACRPCIDHLVSTERIYENSTIQMPITCAQCRALVCCFIRLY